MLTMNLMTPLTSFSGSNEYLPNNYNGVHNLKVHNVESFIPGNDLIYTITKIKRLASTLTTCSYMFSSLGQYQYPSRWVQFLFPGSDLELSGCTDFTGMFNYSAIESFPDISNITMPMYANMSYFLQGAYFHNQTNVSKLVPTFNYGVDLTQAYYTSAPQNLRGSIPENKTWNSGINFQNYNQCFYDQSYLDNYSDAQNYGWA